MGASAGGLEAFQAFLEQMPADSGMAIVLIQHLDPSHESLMPELLAKHTSMPVKVVEDGQCIRPNEVYIGPAKAHLNLIACTLRLTPKTQPEARPVAIDYFFRSAARDQRENVIGIICSGTGTDGTLGLGAIKQEGGLTMAQSPDSAKYDGMPRSAVTNGVVDHVLPIHQMPGVILEYVRHAFRFRDPSGGHAQQLEVLECLPQVFPILLKKTGHDFSRYKQSTMVRRVQRRVQVTHSSSPGAYLKLLRSSKTELEELFKDLLIGVTQFFRDTQAFEALANIALPEIFRDKASDAPVRIWVPGCATGEEPFSLAMLIADYRERRALANPVQIFATDLDEEALAFARKAQFPKSILEQIASEHWQRYVVELEGSLELVKEVREMCIFSLHNVIKDPPFCRLDLISCRNLLIYLEPGLQKKLLPLFHYALNPSGFLFLGPSESVAGRSDLFRIADKKHRIFQRKPAMLRPGAGAGIPALQLESPARITPAQMQVPGVIREQTVARSIERVLLEELAPPAMVINEQGEVLYFSGQVGDYLQPAAGVPSNKAINLTRKSLRLDLRSALQAALSGRRLVVRENLRVQVGREVRRINLIVRPLSDVSKEPLLLVAFQALPESPSAPGPEAASAANEQEKPLLQQLENELRATKDELQNTIEELETSNEELRSANEELLSMNEELQSTNEEMQTSKEELQSLNEELQRKMEELDLAHTDLQNLVESCQMPTLFLDPQLRIRKFTPAIAKLANLDEKQIGQALSAVAPDLAIPALVNLASETIRSLHAKEEQIWFERNQAWFMVRSIPYRNLEQAVLGTVMTFTDITEMRRAQEHRAELAAIVEGSADAVLGLGLDTLVRAWNKGAERIYGWTAEEMIGRPVAVTVPPDKHEEFQLVVERLRHGEHIEPLETVRLNKAQQRIDVLITFSTIRGPSGEITGFSLIGRDMRDARRAEATARHLAAIVESSDDAIVSKDLNGIITSWNKGAATLFGYTAEEIIGRPVTTFIPLERYPEEQMILSRLRRGEKIDHFETIRQRKDGKLIEVSITVSPVKDGQDRIVGASKIARDITVQKQAERLLAEAKERLAKANEELESRVQVRTKELAASTTQLEELVYSIAHDLRAPLRAMQSFATMLLEDCAADLKENGNDYARRIMRSAESLDRMILDLLAYGRLGQEEIELHSVNVQGCWAAAVAQNTELIAQHRGVVEAVEPLLPVRAHRAILTQVLANLLSNGLRFHPEDRAPLVRICTEARPGTVRISVEDNGIGIESKYHERIFGVFQQLHGRQFGGTGVGLAIVRRGVERMGGRVGLESTVGLGSCFWVELPQA
ncbi:MAG TPA: chemotaxis protein CheB [Verrucomicrobiae bacterium]|nr:chemotaxis protein CheB [Verrucomicrobiae bacterium]